MTNLDEIKARRGKITQGKWEIPPDEDGFLDGSVNCGDKHIALCNYFESTFGNMNMSVTLEDQKNNTDFIANAPTDIDWLIGEVERLLTEVKSLKTEKESMASVSTYKARVGWRRNHL